MSNNYAILDNITSCCLDLDKAKNSFQRKMLESVFDDSKDNKVVLMDSMSKYLSSVFEAMDTLYKTLQEDQGQ